MYASTQNHISNYVVPKPPKYNKSNVVPTYQQPTLKYAVIRIAFNSHQHQIVPIDAFFTYVAITNS